MNSKSFSIIVPFFNSESYVEKNIASVANQTYDKDLIQLIVVDDGSKNDAQKLIEQLSEKYQIKIDFFRKKNGNWGSVINYVLENKIAKNDYVMVLDSDDCLKTNCFAYVNKNIKDAEIYAISFKRWNGQNKQYCWTCPFWQISSNVDNKRKKTPYCGPLHYFYKNELFYKLKPLKENVFYQDSVLNAQLVNKANKIRFTKKVLALYYFRREGASTSLGWTEQRFNQEYDACKELVQLNWQEIVAYRLAIKEFRMCCDKYQKKFKTTKKPRFLFFPWFLRPIYLIYYWVKLKKYFIYVD